MRDHSDVFEVRFFFLTAHHAATSWNNDNRNYMKQARLLACGLQAHQSAA